MSRNIGLHRRKEKQMKCDNCIYFDKKTGLCEENLDDDGFPFEPKNIIACKEFKAVSIKYRKKITHINYRRLL